MTMWAQGMADAGVSARSVGEADSPLPATSHTSADPAADILVSIVIPCYRQAHLVGDAIASALAQTHPRIEVIVVDDGSPPEDDPAPIVAQYPGVRLVRKLNGGLASARNAGWRVSSGEYLVFLDGDDVLLPQAVAIGLRVFRDHPDCAFVHGLCERQTLDGRCLPTKSPWIGDFDHQETLLRGNIIRGIHSVMFRRGAFEAVDGFDERQGCGQDWECYLRLTHRFPAFGHGELVGIYRRHDRNVNSSRNAARMLADSMLVLDKQRRYIEGNAKLEAAMRDGRKVVRGVFGDALATNVVGHVRSRNWSAAWREGYVLLRHDPARLLRRSVAALARLWRRAQDRYSGRAAAR